MTTIKKPLKISLLGFSFSVFAASTISFFNTLSPVQARLVNMNCAPLSNRYRILASTNPNEIHPAGQGNSNSTYWSFIRNEVIKNDTSSLETVDLISTSGIDWKAVLMSIQERNVKYSKENIPVQKIKNQTGNAFVIRLFVPAKANSSEIENQAKQLYQERLKALEAKYYNELKAKDEQIAIYRQYNADLYNIVQILASKPIQNIAYSESQSTSDIFNNNNTGATIGNFANQLKDNASQQANQYIGKQQPVETITGAKTILILAANPRGTSTLRLDEEVREIEDGLQRAKKRELFDLKQRWAVRVQDVYQALLDYKPRIVHFSGHGTGDSGLALEDESGNLQLANTDALSELFKLFSSSIECIVLNACYSEVQAAAIVKHVPYVVGMNKAISDKAAIKFATGFYNAIGAGESVEFAYKLGCNVIQLEGIPEHMAPVLLKK